MSNMPQMSPLSWAPLMIITTLLMMTISMHLFWTSNPMTTKMTKKTEKSTFSWKW